jgi:peroxiredoxin
MKISILCRSAFCFAMLAVGAVALAGPTEEDSVTGADQNIDQDAELVLAGHSLHGEAFNEGPRQAAVLIEGMGNIAFPAETKQPETLAFINQGVAALHGFWYLEAERAFRQAAQLEPDLAIPYWGMAMANLNTKDRAQDLIVEAVQRRDSASEHERLYIDALATYLKKPEGDQNDDQKKAREQRLIKDLEKILDQHPEDIEAKAFLALRMWESSRAGLPITSYYAIDALLGQVFAANPNHPAHHYRIHLWDSERPENALGAAAMCGPAVPAIAHMWHMPGHIYSRLHRYGDAAWQQEASARVDHAHMIRTRLMPDQIHNFAHNNEWLTRNLIYLGRVQDALVQSRNLVSLPRHPAYNSLKKRGSYRYGRIRLLQTLTEFELWETLLTEAAGPYLDPTTDEGMQHERLAWMAVANQLLGHKDQARELQWSLRENLLRLQSQQIALEKQVAGAEPDASSSNATEADRQVAEDDADEEDESKDVPPKKQLDRIGGDIRQLEEFIHLVKAAKHVADKNAKAFKTEIEQAGRIEKTLVASWLSQAGDPKAASEDLKKIVDDSPGQIRPLAVLVDSLWRADLKDEAVKQFEKLRSTAAVADLDTELLKRIQPVAQHASIEGDWRIAAAPAADLGIRPELDTLGPFSWQPYPAPRWNAVDADGQAVTDENYQGRPRIVIFYLGFGCLHCVEQLKAFQPFVDRFAQQGIDIVGISTEPVEEFQKGVGSFDAELPFPLITNPDHEAFHAHRCWDDFENQPLHGTFLIDSAGRVRWQDIGHEPFTDAEFLFDEARRLLAMPESP